MVHIAPADVQAAAGKTLIRIRHLTIAYPQKHQGGATPAYIERKTQMKKTCLILATTLLMVVLTVAVTQAKSIANAIWADGELFGVTLTPKDVPNKGPFDIIYNFADSGLAGQRGISDSKPGDTDYNGGRWEVKLVTFTDQGKSVHDPDGDGVVNFELKSAEDVITHAGLGHLTISEPVRYFVCPLHPQKGN